MEDKIGATWGIYTELYDIGIQALPCVGKVPGIKEWRCKKGGPQLFKYGESDWDGRNIGVRCGEIIGGEAARPKGLFIEAIDFDIKYGETFSLFEGLCRSMYPDVWAKLYIESTPSGGRHIVYVYESEAVKIDGNLKLAQLVGVDGKKVCPIETRGEGGYIIVAPSLGYTVIQGDILRIADKGNILTATGRDALIAIGRSFNKVTIEKKVLPPRMASGGDYLGVLDRFNSEYDVIGLLERHGWEVKSVRDASGSGPRSGEYFLTKPGSKSKIHHATFNYARSGVFYNFSSNAEPFDSEKGYSVFAVYSLLEHGGNNKEAYKGVLGLGYGPSNTLPAKPAASPLEKGVATKTDVAIKMEGLAYQCLVNGTELGHIVFGEFADVVGGNIGEGEVKKIFEKLYKDKAAFFGFNKKTTQAKAEIMIKDRFVLYRNMVNNGLFYKNGSALLDKISITEVWGEVGRLIDVRRETIKNLCELKGVTKEYDPFLEYFESLTWDGEDEIGKFSKYIRVEEQEFHDAHIEKMFIRCIHCMLGKGENRFVWTYVGGQYIGKSYLIRFFCPDRLKEYYTEEKPTSDKDCIIRLQENGFYNWEELQSSTNFEINQMKAMISKAVNKIRRPYGTEESTAPRRANFFASTNEDQFLTDDENTRWLPFKIISIDPQYSKDIDIDRCWAQAYHKYKAGVDFKISRDEIAAQHEVTDKYRFMPSEEELILNYFIKIDPNSQNERERTEGVMLSAIDIMNKINIVTSKGIKISKERIGRVLSRKKYYKKRDSYGVFKYLVIDMSGADISSSDNKKYNPYSQQNTDQSVRQLNIPSDEELPF